MTSLRLYDTFAREKRDFVPAQADRITMYLCGPTVYGRAHIGNARPAVVFDVLARLLRHLFPTHRLDYARNITDVDDKIIAAAAAEGVDPSVITARFEKHYLDDTAALGVAAPPIQPHATTHVPDMIAMIARLVDLRHAYAADGHVLFAVASDPDYGSLSRRDAEAMRAGARIEIAPYKRDASDFILWKPSDPGVIGWDSPWGRGRPGWHIECSAMIERHLGRTIDIHAGGQDLIFPHHENEAAQSRCAHGGAPLANIWMHNGFVNMSGGDKMSKSVGNVVGIDGLLAAGHHGETLRLALLSAHYRQPLEWTDELLKQTKARLDRWYRAYALWLSAKDEPHDYTPGLSGFFQGPSGEPGGLTNDLDVPWALATLDVFLKPSFDSFPSSISRKTILGDLKVAINCAKLLGFLSLEPAEWFTGGHDPAVETRVDERSRAKARRDFAEADRIRAELSAQGILLEDTPAGTTWRRA